MLFHLFQDLPRKTRSRFLRNMLELWQIHSGAPVAQLDRASGYEPEGREFESLRARHFPNKTTVESSHRMTGSALLWLYRARCAIRRPFVRGRHGEG
jgi:hypothetical protein